MSRHITAEDINFEALTEEYSRLKLEEYAYWLNFQQLKKCITKECSICVVSGECSLRESAIRLMNSYGASNTASQLRLLEAFMYNPAKLVY